MVKVCAVVTDLMTSYLTLFDQVSLYANRLSTNEADNKSLQKAVITLQGGVKNLTFEVATVKRSGHSSGAGAAKNKRGIP